MTLPTSGASSNYLYTGGSGGFGDAGWLLPPHKYLGVQFNSASQHHYGWIEISIDGPNKEPMHIYSYGYENQANTPLAAGVPEPSTALLFAAVGYFGNAPAVNFHIAQARALIAFHLTTKG